MTDFNVAFTPVGRRGQNTLAMTVPSPLGKLLSDSGMWRAEITLTDTGFLVEPYVADRGSRASQKFDRPKWALNGDAA